MDVLQTALGLRVAIVDLHTGETLSGGEALTLCDENRSPGLSCLVQTERELDSSDPLPVRAVCDDGMPVVLQPVRVEGEQVAHVMLYGFVGSQQERIRILQRAMAGGRAEADARSAADELTLLDRTRVDAAAALVGSRVEQLLTEQYDETRRVGRQLEVALLADVARELGPEGLVYDRIPVTSLATMLRLTGAVCARVSLMRIGADLPEAVAEVGDCASFLEPPADDELVSHVLETGRSIVVTGTDDAGRKSSTITVPLGRRQRVSGALSVVKTGQGALAADDVRLIELFAEILSAMLDNAQDFVDANTRLVEMIQIGEVAKALNSTLDFDRLSELAVQVLAKTLDFQVGGFVIEGFGSLRGRIMHTGGVSEGDLLSVLGEARGLDETAEVPAGVDVVARLSEAVDEAAPGERDWTVLTRELHFRNIRAGVLFVASSDPGVFRGDDERVLQALASHLSVALENSTLYERLQTDFARAMAALTAMADATERLESGHTDRVMDYAVAIGEAMDLSIERLGLLRFAGLLHDLGKVGVAEDILIKPSALTEEEMARVRRHSEVGASIVEQIRVLEELTPIVRHHHEHWDGTGYPDELAGDAIPLEARILAVADSYEAMTGKRTHRKRMASASARLELQRGVGTQFDPEVVEAFLQILDLRALGGSTGAYGVVMRGTHLPA
jgi:HD-GYP domain-containing protein (c-di-GMP phosphodiesterase class II)